MPMLITTAETRWVPFEVAGVDLTNGQVVDPTSMPVEIGFVSSLDGGQVPPPVFYPGIWIANTTRRLFYAAVLVGPNGAVQLDPGTYVPWCQFPFGAEVILHPVKDTLTCEL